MSINVDKISTLGDSSRFTLIFCDREDTQLPHWELPRQSCVNIIIKALKKNECLDNGSSAVFCVPRISHVSEESQNTFSWRFYNPSLQTGKLRHGTIMWFAWVDTANYLYLQSQATEPLHSRTLKTVSENATKRKHTPSLFFAPPLKHLLSTSSWLWPLPSYPSK